MDIKQLVDNACLVWKESDPYKPSNVRLFSDNTKEIAKTILQALDGQCLYSAMNILEACKMALKQAPIYLEKEKPP